MTQFKAPIDLLKWVAQLRRDHGDIRAEVATRCALGQSYVNGRQWTTVSPSSGGAGNLIVDSWNEDWDPRSAEIRVTDNRIGPMFRRIAADTNATRIEAQVFPPRFQKTFDSIDQAVVAQSILNSISDDVGMTRIARSASALRWVCGSALIQLQLSSKKRKIPTNLLRRADGSAIEINDKWVRWKVIPITDLIWDPSNTSADLEDHHELVLEQVYTIKQFNQEFGKTSNYGINEDDLPMIEDIAPYHLAAAAIGGDGAQFYASYQRNRQEKGLRVVQVYLADPRDPTRWPINYTIFDTSADFDLDRVSGTVINFKDPTSPFGGHGRPLFKLDAFRRSDAVLPHGAPHVMMGDQDRLNLLESTKFQQLLNVVHGMWLLDTRTANRDEFLNDLSTGVGGVLRWDSKGGELSPPQYVTPPPPNQVWIPMEAAIGISLREQVHMSAQNFGQAKTHIPKDFQQRMLQESNAVVDNIIIRDVDLYSDALATTLGTVRLAMEQPSRMTARLRDKHGLKAEDLQAFLKMSARNSALIVRVRTHSIVSRSVEQRTQELMVGVQAGLLTPKQVIIAMAEELERPMIDAHDQQLQFCHRSVRQIVAGSDWPGMPSLDSELFQHSAEKALFGLDVMKDEDRAAIKRLQEAILIQKQLFLENNLPPQGGPLDQAQPEAVQSSGNPNQQGGGGPPASIDPNTAPVGAAGGLPLGLDPEG